MEMPAKKRRRINKDRHIPEVLIEKILLNLPIKSLFRFSTVSKPWNSIIFGSKFAKSYRGREMMVLRCYSDEKALVCPVSSLSSAKPLDRATPFARPFKAHSYSNASCGQLWCVEFEKTLLLYNPSIRAYRKLPIPSSPVPIGATIGTCPTSVFVYGLGYDCVADDYKVLKIHRDQYVEAELYSLKRDCWRVVESRPPSHLTFFSPKGEFVSGNEMKGVVSSTDMRKMFVCEDGSTLVEKSFGGHGCGMFDTYVESFVLFSHDHDHAQAE